MQLHHSTGNSATSTATNVAVAVAVAPEQQSTDVDNSESEEEHVECLEDSPPVQMSGLGNGDSIQASSTQAESRVLLPPPATSSAAALHTNSTAPQDSQTTITGTVASLPSTVGESSTMYSEVAATSASRVAKKSQDTGYTVIDLSAAADSDIEDDASVNTKRRAEKNDSYTLALQQRSGAATTASTVTTTATAPPSTARVLLPPIASLTAALSAAPATATVQGRTRSSQNTAAAGATASSSRRDSRDNRQDTGYPVAVRGTPAADSDSEDDAPIGPSKRKRARKEGIYTHALLQRSDVHRAPQAAPSTIIPILEPITEVLVKARGPGVPYTEIELARLQQLLPAFSGASRVKRKEICRQFSAEWRRSEAGVHMKLMHLLYQQQPKRGHGHSMVIIRMYSPGYTAEDKLLFVNYRSEIAAGRCNRERAVEELAKRFNAPMSLMRTQLAYVGKKLDPPRVVPAKQHRMSTRKDRMQLEMNNYDGRNLLLTNNSGGASSNSGTSSNSSSTSNSGTSTGSNSGTSSSSRSSSTILHATLSTISSIAPPHVSKAATPSRQSPGTIVEREEEFEEYSYHNTDRHEEMEHTMSDSSRSSSSSSAEESDLESMSE